MKRFPGNILSSLTALTLCACFSTVAEVPTIRGKVLTVREETRDAVLDVGEVDGVKRGMTFRAFREKTFVALMQVYFVSPDMCVAKVSNQAIPLLMGDQVTTRLLVADSSKDVPVEPDKAPLPPQLHLPEVKGSIWGVQNEVNLALFGLGSSQGVQKGQRFTVSRGNEWVATIVADRVYGTWSIGIVEAKSEELRKGDLVFNQKD
ncbi:MAG: hypothetical protein O3B01_23810 [Planctomycetota bacterium]|nr:hypothetical protein [Planctomycetota bacterium]